MIFTADAGDVAVVLGPGGPVGTAWLLGLAAGLREAGVELSDADLLIGTSAGAIAAAALAVGRNLDELADLPPAPPESRVSDPTVMPRVLRMLNTPGADPHEALRQAGALALSADALPEERHVAAMERLVGAAAWPDRPLLITAVDAESGERVVWTRDSGVPLHIAVAASSAAPGHAAPITIGAHRYMDGALGGGSNVHLADGAGTMVLVEPLGHMFPGPRVEAGVRIVPDEAALEAFGPDVSDRNRWGQVYESGRRQSAALADRIRPYLPGGRSHPA
ncbi:patatin-like phospholipase family protein [Nonomuraea sp. NPDC052265]|uniref:patatin-like phospholipase family protein n=1 Tax=Nonomuraea sp. NPDC052265 TaxID=3364374 RepID=UPI0037C505E0